MNKNVHTERYSIICPACSIRYDITARIISFHGSGPKELVPKFSVKDIYTW